MAYTVPAAKQSKGQDKFTFGPVTGTEFSVRKAKLLKLRLIEQLEATSAAIEFFGPAGTEQGDYIRDLDRDQFQALVKAWRDDSAVTAGE